MSTQSSKLASDIKVLVHDAEQLVKATAAETSDKVVAAVIELATPTAMAADRYVHTHPWPAIGVSALAGLLIGLLASRN